MVTLEGETATGCDAPVAARTRRPPFLRQKLSCALLALLSFSIMLPLAASADPQAQNGANRFGSRICEAANTIGTGLTLQPNELSDFSIVVKLNNKRLTFYKKQNDEELFWLEITDDNFTICHDKYKSTTSWSEDNDCYVEFPALSALIVQKIPMPHPKLRVSFGKKPEFVTQKLLIFVIGSSTSSSKMPRLCHEPIVTDNMSTSVIDFVAGERIEIYEGFNFPSINSSSPDISGSTVTINNPDTLR
ncbi:MAG: hypothetical protein IPL88_03420 [Rhizobiales bacterium]|nr:hypothetical protein [Hyphomicrobiales bacterium]